MVWKKPEQLLEPEQKVQARKKKGRKKLKTSKIYPKIIIDATKRYTDKEIRFCKIVVKGPAPKAGSSCSLKSNSGTIKETTGAITPLQNMAIATVIAIDVEPIQTLANNPSKSAKIVPKVSPSINSFKR